MVNAEKLDESDSFGDEFGSDSQDGLPLLDKTMNLHKQESRVRSNFDFCVSQCTFVQLYVHVS